jgi:hypothetical protein
MRNKRLERKAKRVIAHKRAMEARIRRIQRKNAIKFINKWIIKEFHKFILSEIETGRETIILDIDKIVSGGKAIGRLDWRKEYRELVSDRLTAKYPSFEYELKGNMIHITYNKLLSEM